MEPNILNIHEYKIVLAMIGLPARGKSYTANRLANFMNWCGLPCRVFNAGEYRRALYGTNHDYTFFDSSNDIVHKQKEYICKVCLTELFNWLINGGNIAIFDATNSTQKRRSFLIDQCNQQKVKIKLIFIELIADDEKTIKQNLTMKMKSPDYIDKTEEFAINDFTRRTEQYEKIYQQITNKEKIGFIKKFNVNSQILIDNVSGTRESIIISYLINLKIVDQPVYITRHGESYFNRQNKIGGDSDITENGQNYAKKLSDYLNLELKNKEFIIITSCLKRTIQTAAFIQSENSKCIQSRLLNEIHAGIYEGRIISDLDKTIISQRNNNKLEYRYQEGESYLDLFERLQNFILQILSIDLPIVIVGHQAINRILLGYFLRIKRIDVPHIENNLNEVIKLSPNAKGYTKEVINLK